MTYPIARIHVSTLRKLVKDVIPMVPKRAAPIQRTVVYHEVSRRILVVRNYGSCIPGDWWFLMTSRIGDPVEYDGKLIIEGKAAEGDNKCALFDPMYPYDDYEGTHVYYEVIVVPDEEEEVVPKEIS